MLETKSDYSRLPWYDPDFQTGLPTLPGNMDGRRVYQLLFAVERTVEKETHFGLHSSRFWAQE